MPEMSVRIGPILIIIINDVLITFFLHTFCTFNLSTWYNLLYNIYDIVSGSGVYKGIIFQWKYHNMTPK